MSLALRIGEAFRSVLVTFLLACAVLLFVLLLGLCVQRACRNWLSPRRARQAARLQPIVDGVLMGSVAAPQLAAAARFSRRTAAMVLLDSTAALAGPIRDRAREAGVAARLDQLWRRDLDDRRWWRRAEAVRAHGLFRLPESFERLADMMTDPHEEVRAAVVEALGRLGDERAVTPLLASLRHQAQYQRVRVIEALRAIGPWAGADVLAYVRENIAELPDFAPVLSVTAGAAALDLLIAAAAGEDAAIRAAALESIASIGVDDRAYYFALRALSDESPLVRAAAARVLGRSGRQDATAYLVRRLDDEWDVAANAARALGRLAESGRAALATVAAGEGGAADLAKQVLWESAARARG